MMRNFCKTQIGLQSKKMNINSQRNWMLVFFSSSKLSLLKTIKSKMRFSIIATALALAFSGKSLYCVYKSD
jgi:hypothetical protein